MAVIITDAGLEWLGDRTIGNVTDKIAELAIGTGTTAPTSSDTSLENEVYREVATINELSATGKYELVIEVIGGTEIAANTSISEVGIFTDDATSPVMFARETFPAVTVGSGERQTFAFPIDFTQ